LAQDKSEFKVGDRVKHQKLGAGDILDIYPFGEETCAVISFEKAGQKKIVLKYAKLERVAVQEEEPEGGDE
jgi:DNA helicase-2/ATP-dependent DNA helicase PcrA